MLNTFSKTEFRKCFIKFNFTPFPSSFCVFLCTHIHNYLKMVIYDSLWQLSISFHCFLQTSFTSFALLFQLGSSFLLSLLLPHTFRYPFDSCRLCRTSNLITEYMFTTHLAPLPYVALPLFAPLSQHVFCELLVRKQNKNKQKQQRTKNKRIKQREKKTKDRSLAIAFN